MNNLKEILAKHALWLSGENDGERADLQRVIEALHNLDIALTELSPGYKLELNLDLATIYRLTYEAYHLTPYDYVASLREGKLMSIRGIKINELK